MGIKVAVLHNPTSHIDTEEKTEQVNQRNLRRNVPFKYDNMHNNWIKTCHKVSMSTEFIFVQKSVLVSFLEVLSLRLGANVES